MKGFTRSRLVASAMAGVAFGGIAVSQGSPPTTAPPPEKHDRSTATASPRTEINADITLVAPVPDNQADAGSPMKTSGVAGTAGVTGTAAAGPGCYPAVSASATAILYSTAAAKAKELWMYEAVRYGPSSWEQAQAKSTSCKRQGQAQRWTCVVTGQPCIAGSAPLPDPTPACYPEMTATGPWRKLQGTAENHARDQWQHDAGNAHGTNYKWWNKARNGDISCSHDGRKPLVRQWQCRARAEPCF